MSLLWIQSPDESSTWCNHNVGSFEPVHSHPFTHHPNTHVLMTLLGDVKEEMAVLRTSLPQQLAPSASANPFIVTLIRLALIRRRLIRSHLYLVSAGPCRVDDSSFSTSHVSPEQKPLTLHLALITGKINASPTGSSAPRLSRRNRQLVDLWKLHGPSLPTVHFKMASKQN